MEANVMAEEQRFVPCEIRFYTVDDLMQMLGWSKTTVLKLFNDPKFPSTDFGRNKVVEAHSKTWISIFPFGIEMVKLECSLHLTIDFHHVQEFMFSRYKIMEIYLANDRCLNVGQTNAIWIAKEATALLRSQTVFVSDSSLALSSAFATEP